MSELTVYASRGTGVRDASRFDIGRDPEGFWVVRRHHPLHGDSSKDVVYCRTLVADWALQCFKVAEYRDTREDVERKAQELADE